MPESVIVSQVLLTSRSSGSQTSPGYQAGSPSSDSGSESGSESGPESGPVAALQMFTSRSKRYSLLEDLSAASKMLLPRRLLLAFVAL